MAQHNLSDDSAHAASAQYEIPCPLTFEFHDRYLMERYITQALINVWDDLHTQGSDEYTLEHLRAMLQSIATPVPLPLCTEPRPNLLSLWFDAERRRWPYEVAAWVLTRAPRSAFTRTVQNDWLFKSHIDIDSGLATSYRWRFRCIQLYLASFRDPNSTFAFVDDTAQFVRHAELMLDVPSYQQR